MEAFKRQASKLREQVAKQQQALLRQLGHFDAEALIADEAEIARHHQLQNLYISTRAAKHFEKDIIHGIEDFISVSSKQIEIERRFAQDCSRYATENHCSTSLLAEAAMCVCASRNLVVEEEALLEVFDEQVRKPLRALVRSAELEDARLLIRRYDKLWQEVEVQAAEVLRLRSKSTVGTKSGEISIKLQFAEEKLDELKSRLMALGKEAATAMLSVEAQQQRMTFQQLVVMVNGERSFHHSVVTILDKLLAEMIQMEQMSESSAPADAMRSHSNAQEADKNTESNAKERVVEHENSTCFIAKVIHPFDAEAEGELSLSVDDTVMVQQVIPGGWSKGECNGKTGWFPSPYVERLDQFGAGQIIRASQLQ